MPLQILTSVLTGDLDTSLSNQIAELIAVNIHI